MLLYRRNRAAFFLAAFAFVTFVPASNLLFPFGTIMAERLLYLPLIGVLACLVLGLYAAGRRFGSPRLAPAVLAVLMCGFRGADRGLQFRLAGRSLARPRLRRNCAPDSFKTHRMLAEALYAADPSHTAICNQCWP